MTTPSPTAEASLYTASQYYRSAAVSAAGRFDSVLAQQLQQLPDMFRCSPCINGRQFCCPPPGFGIACFVRSCISPL